MKLADRGKAININHIEAFFFFVLMLLNLSPVFSVKVFTTLDGPAHLYNANLLNQLLQGNSDLVSAFFSINPVLVPNWTGHALLAFFMNFLSPANAEKLLLCLMLIALPLSFRKLVKQEANSSGSLLSFMIFPFSYSLTFLLGFYNYTIGLILYFTVMSFWLKHRQTLSKSFKKVLLLCVLISLTYLSHLLVFGILLISIALYELILMLRGSATEENKSLTAGIRNISILLLSSVFAFLMLFQFWTFRTEIEKEYIFVEKSTLIDWITSCRTLVAFNSEEAVYAKVVFYSLSFFFVFLVSRSIIKGVKVKSVIVKLTREFWLWMALLFLVLFFTLPNSDGVGGIILTRISWFFYISLILYLSRRRIPGIFSILCLIVVFYAHFSLNSYYVNVQESRSRAAKELLEVSESVEANSIVLPLNHSANWTFAHYSNFMGVIKPMVILKNYEADRGYFPVSWNGEAVPNVTIADRAIAEVHSPNNWPLNKNNQSVNVDYILVQGRLADSHQTELVQLIREKFELVTENKSCLLYRFKARDS